MKRKHGYVNIDKFNTYAVCRKCKASCQWQSPMALSAFARIVKEFIEIHRDCKERKI